VRDVVNHVGVVGAGQMGTGIALVAAVNAGTLVTVVDANAASIRRCEKQIDKFLDRKALPHIRPRITVSNQLSALSTVDFVVEAVPEVRSLKIAILEELDKVTAPGVIFATNTSSISITALAQARPGQTIGMHFFSPVAKMPIVELILGLQTSPETAQITTQVAKAMGKTVVPASNTPGFVANRLLMPYINEAALALSTGVASRDGIDSIMTLGTRVPMGPLELADFIGLDTCLSIMETLQSGLGGAKYTPAPILIEYADAGWLGKKVGRGFYSYDSNGNPIREDPQNR